MEDAQVIEKKSTSEMVGLDGKTTNPATGSLADLFTSMEKVKGEGGSTDQLLKDASAKPEDKPEVKPEPKPEVTPEIKPEVKDTKPEEKPEVKPEVKSDEEKKNELPEEELQVNPHDKPKTAQRIKQLWSKVKTWETMAETTKKERDEKATKLAELEKKLSEVKTVDPLTDERVKKHLDELAMYKRRYDLDQDPEVKTKYDSRVEQSETAILETLKRRNASEDLLQLIKVEGGWQKFSESGRLVAIPDGEGGTKHVTSAELADVILARLPLGERKAVEAAMVDQVQTKRDRERYFKEEQSKALDYFKKQDEEKGRQTAEQTRQVEEAKKTVDAWRQGVESSEWLKDKEIPANATAEQKASIVEYNKSNAQIKSVLAKNLGAQKLEDLLPVFEDSVKYHDERRRASQLIKENESLKAELKAKADEIAKFRKGGSSVSRGGSLAGGSAATVDTGKKPLSLEETFERMERGEKILVRAGDDNE